MSQLASPVAPADPLYTRWMAEIARYESDAKKWVTRSNKIVKRYKDDRRGPADEARTKYNILWSNLQVLMPAVYAKNPVPEVERSFKDEDPVGREAAEVLERCLEFCIKSQSFKDIMRSAVLDRFLPGRGVVWVRYVPHITQAEPDPEQPGELTDDAQPAPQEKLAGDTEASPVETIDYEECLADYVHWRDFGHTIARTWPEVTAVWRIVYLTRKECVKRFGEEIGSKIPLSASDMKNKASGASDNTLDADLKKAVIYEIWDKSSGTAMWLCKEYPQGLLDKKDDPLRLSGFFPCPRPLFATLDNDSVIPTPDFVLYQDQADELDVLTARITLITKAIKVAGVYNSAAQGVERLLSEGTENQLVPVDAWAMFAEKGGLKGAMELLPVKEIAETLLALYDARDRVKQDLYEITGLSDIIRGANDPTETATATRAKSAFASIRLRDMQDEVSRFARDILRIMGEVIAEHFGVETMARISGVDLPTEAAKQQIQMSLQPRPAPPMMGAGMVPGMPAAPAPQQPPAQPSPEQLLTLQKPTWEQVGQLLQDDAARNFRIDIETDSTIGEDEEKQKAERLEMLKAVAAFLQQAIPAIQANPQMGPLLGQMLMFTLRSFKAGRTLENVFEATMKKLEEAASQPPKDPNKDKADADLAKVQAQGQTAIQVNQAKIAAEERQAEREAQLKQQTAFAEQQAQAQQAAQQVQLELHRDEMKTAMEERLRTMEAAQNDRNDQMQATLQLILQKMKGETALEVAEVAAGATLDAAQISAANQASGDD